MAQALSKLPIGKPGPAMGGRKSNPANLTKLLDRIISNPLDGIYKTCLFCGMTYNTLRRYLEKSETGKPGDGFDINYGDETKRFHLHYEDACQTRIQITEDAYIGRAMAGYYEVLHDKGRVIYQMDPELEGLGLTGADAYLRDEEGKPIPERIEHQDPEVMLMVLRAWRRDRYGAKDQLDVTVRGGVMVVSGRAKSSADIEQQEKELLEAPMDVEFREVEDE
jgi:hypothetical protein